VNQRGTKLNVPPLLGGAAALESQKGQGKGTKEAWCLDNRNKNKDPLSGPEKKECLQVVGLKRGRPLVKNGEPKGRHNRSSRGQEEGGVWEKKKKKRNGVWLESRLTGKRGRLGKG